MAKRGKKAKAKSKGSSSKRVARKPAKARKATAKKRPAKKRPAKKRPAKKRPTKPKKAAARSKAVTKNARPVVRVSAPRPAVVAGPIMIPELPEVEGYVRGLPPPVKPIVNMLRRIVRDAAPEAHEIYMGGPAYAANGLFARIEAHEREVLIRFLKGSALDAPEGVLEGRGGERHVTVHDLGEVKESVLKALVRQAVLLNLRPDNETPPPPPPEALDAT